jgi:hypothetical protein
MMRLNCLTNQLTIALALTLPLLGSPVFAQSSTPAVASPIHVNINEIKTQAKVVELDVANRIAVIRTPKRQYITVRIPAELHNFDQVKVGDDIVISFTIAVAAQIEPAAKSDGIRETIESSSNTNAKPGDKPGMSSERTVEVIALIQSIDRNAGTATLQGATRTVTIAVPKTIDIAQLKVGDEVHAVFHDAVVVAVEAAPASAAKPAKK